MSRSILYTVGMVTIFTILFPGGAGIAQDFEIAREAVERGEIQPLSKLMPRIAMEYSGTVIEVELELSKDKKVYEFEILTESGQLLEVDVDAATGEVLSVDEDD